MRIGTILLLLAVGLSYHEETEFLNDAGFPHLVDNFRGEEIIMRMMNRLSNQELTELGLATMGARIRFREAVDSRITRDAAGEATGDAAGEAAREADGDGRDNAVLVNEAATEDSTEGVQGDRRTDNDTGSETVEGANIQEENGPNVEVDGERNLIFYVNTLSTGRITHHFLDHFYRFDRNKVRANGRAFFRCSVRGCTAR